MKLNSLFKLVQDKVDKNERGEYYNVICELDECRKDLGYKNDIDNIFDNIDDIFPYMISDESVEKTKHYEQLCNEICSWLNRQPIHYSFDEVSTETDNDDCDDQDETAQNYTMNIEVKTIDQETANSCIKSISVLQKDVSFLTVIVTASTFINTAFFLFHLVGNI
jgi:hypothetical protein